MKLCFIKNTRKTCFIISLFFLISCAPTPPNKAQHYSHLPEINGFKTMGIVFLNNNIYAQKCDNSRNKLWMKFSKINKKWVRIKYISKDC